MTRREKNNAKTGYDPRYAGLRDIACKQVALVHASVPTAPASANPNQSFTDTEIGSMPRTRYIARPHEIDNGSGRREFSREVDRPQHDGRNWMRRGILGDAQPDSEGSGFRFFGGIDFGHSDSVAVAITVDRDGKIVDTKTL